MKALITSGCSLAETTSYPNLKTWPLFLKDHLAPEYFNNTGQGSTGTDFISKKIIYQCTKALEIYKPEDILCVASFTTLYRTAGLFEHKDLFPTKLKNSAEALASPHNPTWYLQGCDYDTKRPKTGEGWYYWNLWRDDENFAYYYTFYNSHLNLLEQYLWNIVAVINFCKANNIEFIYMFVNDDVPNNVNLRKYRDHWATNHLRDIVFNDTNYKIKQPIATWVTEHYPTLMGDDIHPNTEGHKQYVNQILLPVVDKIWNK